MSRYPTPSDYQEAIQVPETAFEDSVLQEATPRTNVLGLPQPITGAFAAVFPMTTAERETVAVKCFLTDVQKQTARYKAVAGEVGRLSCDAFVPFDYQEDGIRVDGSQFPLLKMDWVEGTPLNRFVEEHLDSPSILQKLAERWADLMTVLEEEPIAHGDLQHGNVIVVTDAEEVGLRLVDYDTMYVPALKGWRSAEVGHRNYQHPDRTDADFGPHLDRFSALAIYTAIRACAVRPDLWEAFDTGENLLFRDDDYYEPEQSVLFESLTGIDGVADLAEALRTACYVEPSDVPALSDVRAGRLEPAQVSITRARRERGQALTDRSRFATWFLPALLGLVLGAGGVAGLGLPLAGLGILVLGGTVALLWALHRYRQLSAVRRRRRLEQERARFTSAIEGLQRERDRLTEKREERKNSIEELRAERLAELKDEALYDALKHHFIGEVREVEGVIHKHVVRLKAANIRTAYEATPEAIASVRRISDEARARINMWRSALVQQYEDSIPESLSPAEERRLRRYVEHRIENIDDQVKRTNEKIDVQKRERARITDRLEEIGSLSFWRYVRYLLRIDTLPEPANPRSRRASSRDADSDSSPTAVPEPLPEDEDWWRVNA